MVTSSPFPLLHAALDCVIVMSSAGRIVEFNTSAEATFGRRREDVLGRELAEVIIPERLRDAHRRGFARYLETGASQVLGKRLELPALRADGRELPVELTITAAVVDGERVLVGFVRDLTEATAAARRVERIQASTAALAAARTVMDVAHAVMAAGVGALGAETAVFIRPVGDALGIVASVGVPEEVVASFRTFPRDTPTPTAAVFRTGQSEWVEDEKAFRARYGAAAAELLKTATSAAAALPLRIGDEVAAAVAFRFSERRSFPAPDRALIETFAAQAAQALDRVLAYEQELEGRRKLEALADLTTSLATTLTERDVADAVSDRGMLAMAADTCVLYRLDSDGALALVAERGCSPAIVEKIRRIEPGSSNPSAEAMRSGRTVWVESDAEYHEYFPALAALAVPGRRAKAFWSVPLRVEGATIGLLAMGFYDERRFSAADRVFVETFARNAAQALRRAQRLETEARVRNSLATTLRSIGDAVIATDTQGAITFLNPIAERLTGWSQREALGRPVHEIFRIVNEQTRSPVESPVDRVLREGVVAGLANHTVLVARDGTETPIDDSGAPIRDDSEVMMGVVLVFRDVTAKKLDERRRAFLADAVTTLASSLDYQATLAGVASLAVPIVADWCAVDVVEPERGAGLQRVATAHIDPAKVSLAKELSDRYPPDPQAATGVYNVLRTGSSEFYADIPEPVLLAVAVDDEHLRILRELRLRSAMVVPLIARGQTLGAITFVYAESGRTYVPEDLTFAEDLARRAAVAIDNSRLYAAEQQARQAAVVANRVKDEFLATVSHELRTPLNAITGWAKMLGLAAADPARLSKAITTIERNGAAMARLIDDLLDVSRIVSGKVRLEPVDIDLAHVVEGAVESVRPAAAAKDVVIDVSIDGPATMQGDPKRLEQVVANLLSNALKFSNTGQRVEVAMRRSGQTFEIRVTDQGRGIAPSFLPHVFDPFRQADPTITRRHGGLGLGLAITRELVELHGGRIRAASEGEDRGATFIVTLPAGEQVAASDDAAPPGVPGRLEHPRELVGLRVLLVDDEEDARHLVRTILEECGCSVRSASSAASAMEQLEMATSDVLVSDIGLPEEDGYALMRKIRALPMPRGGLPSVALTAFTRSEDRRRALEAGFTTHLSKPIDPMELVSVVANLARSPSPKPG